MNTIKHDHPACETGPHIHEKVPLGGSAGGDITEGCIEHYDERIVSVDLPSDEKNNLAEWWEYFVMSEILSPPRCKRK